MAPPATKASHKTTASASASDSQISAAKAGGMVWVNTDSGVYHKVAAGTARPRPENS